MTMLQVDIVIDFSISVVGDKIDKQRTGNFSGYAPWFCFLDRVGYTLLEVISILSSKVSSIKVVAYKLYLAYNISKT